MTPPTTLDQIPQDPDDNRPQVRSVSLPSRDQVTAIQVGTLLHATAMLSSLLMTQVDPEDGRKDLRPQISEAAIAAENSVVKILARLDTIIEDKDRWTLGIQRTLESDLSAVYKGHLALIEEQRAGVAAVNMPHRYAGIKLARVDGGLWAAVLGTPGNGDCIVGIGDSPADACADFDRQFNGKPAEKQYEQQDTKKPTVDSSAVTNTPKPPVRRRKLGGDRKDPGPDSKLGPDSL